MTAIPSPPPSAGFDEPDRLTTAMATKFGRGAPPRIDPTVANNAFLQPNIPTPASSIGSHMPSPLSVSSAPRSPVQPYPRQISPDDDSVLNLDNVFSFPMPGNRSPTRVSTHGLSMPTETPARSPARSPAPTPSPRYGLGLDLVPEEVQLPPSPLPPAPESTEQAHQRNESMFSQSSYRTSLASTRYGSSTARSSTNSFSRGFNQFIDETPPLPPAPLRTPNKSSFSRDSELSASSSCQSDRQEPFGGFDFGIPTNPNPSGLNDLLEERSPEEPKASPTQDFPLPPQNHLHPAAAASEPVADTPRKNSDASTHSAVSVTSFARALGLEGQMQKAESSVSSESSPSEANSGSSMSSLPSDTSLSRFKPNDPLNLSPLVEELPPRTRQTILELPGRIRNTMDEVPPIPAAFFSPDSPTDPAINQGSLSLIAERHEESSSPQPPPSDPPSPRRPLQRAATTPIPRPPTRSTTRSKGNCKGCGEEITGKSVSSSDGRLTGKYHRGCFVCFECSSPFQTADFYVLNNKPYCAQHYHERNGSLCSTCHNGIEGEYLETVERTGARPDRRRFHLNCLQCRTCHIMLKGDYFEWNGGVYCERDAQRASNAYNRPPPGAGGHPGPPRLVDILPLEGTAHHLLLHHPREDFVPAHVFLRAVLDDSLSDERQNS
ncbi:hypothetical protein N7509_003078 [Penicillium cosmopolitanum]|uniref:LIM zinc-binding domain-containing protein n=1 Tax=Penicillium cosmopolitanum TaxID=1131564 RepID=A0A9W9W4I2_9EURO|nr:uncharacterized protein N7509_003078 [Penicillium cosmopolitanum]KAJ5403207.1 hypothetical protein N7509_003078 [Penicillium cosmopolitanum]